MIKPSHGYTFYNRIEKVRQALSEGVRFCAPFYITSLIECWSERLRVRTRLLFSRYLSSIRSFTFPSTSTNIRLSAPMRQFTTSYSTSACSGWIFDLSSIHNVCISFSLLFLEHLRNHGRRKFLFRRKGRIEVMSGDSAFGNILLLEDWEANWDTISFYDHCVQDLVIYWVGQKKLGRLNVLQPLTVLYNFPVHTILHHGSYTGSYGSGRTIKTSEVNKFKGIAHTQLLRSDPSSFVWP
jgi:hypothetical protein